MSRELEAGDGIEVGEALLRFGAGIDEGDAALISSAVSAGAIVDFGPCGEKLGLPFAPLEGQEAIASFLAGTHAHQVTSHVVTNVRVTMTAEGAEAQALVQATHISRADPHRRFQMLDPYRALLAPDQGGWRIEHLVIDNIWFEGDPRILLLR